MNNIAVLGQQGQALSYFSQLIHIWILFKTITQISGQVSELLPASTKQEVKFHSVGRKHTFALSPNMMAGPAQVGRSSSEPQT